MATPDELRRLERAATEAQAALSRARAENLAADLAWTRMVDAANAACARGQSVSAEYILAAGARARAGQGIVETKAGPKAVVKLSVEETSDLIVLSGMVRRGEAIDLAAARKLRLMEKDKRR
jgi:hypothetical protein